MTYTQSQAAFAQAIGVILGACCVMSDGRYRLRLDWGYRDLEANTRVGGHPQSLHMDRLAQDVTVYVVAPGGDVSAAPSAETYTVLGKLHDIWDALGGNSRISNDMGHFSWPKPGSVVR